ncbi:hypothetical protein JL722_8462 [Aureococcus anophagefferens]|nr:hypothetical protein JL722_8462 [Aureococcus anophagefferens]
MAEIEGLVRALREGDDAAKAAAARALFVRALCGEPANRVLIAEDGGIPPLALYNIAEDNDANAVAIAVTVGLEALVELARRGRVTVHRLSVAHNAGVPAKRKAALVVAALLGDCVPDSVPREIKTVIGSYL